MDTNELWHLLQTQMDTIKKESDSTHHPILEKALQSLKETIKTYLSEQVTAGLPHPHPRSRIYRSEPKSWDIYDRSSQEILDLILKKTKNSKRKPACVFDLDGTLFDVGYRTLGILNEWLASEASHHFDKRLLQKIAKLNYSHIGYSLSHAFENSGFDLRNQEMMSVFSAVERFWKRKFFDGNTLVKYDKLMNNADIFVNELNKNDIAIFYLTGRYSHSMLKGTEQQLQNFNFPFEKNKLILKHNPHADDQIFKAEQIRNIAEEYDIVGNFENEYLNIAFMSLEAKDAINVIVDSQHSGRATPSLDMPIYRISHFNIIE
ncbi:HAD family acid phosphatase [Fluviispira multicolorata]|uniref:Haloacid dehalogenase-like hydrolase n=1 Tax=Fluviispira multicolorata TaxID=2654512 RepID=A0A833JCH7_9BACT|nr:HAD family acid phosphatase [Fluviispira multicolorata]KAB8030731.1 hypothetical protein GCL57_07095 [Fluviispira multicolorata]